MKWRQHGKRGRTQREWLCQEIDENLKEEVDLSECEDLADAWRQLGRFLDDLYNTKHIHSSLGYLTRSDLAQQWVASQCT